MAARICCLDLDTFFVSVERLFRPDLIGKPVVVGARPGTRGVVTAASYEVREFGVRAGMSSAEAYRLAPHAIFVSGSGRDYSEWARRVKAILERYTPIVRTASIDEFFLDFRSCEAMYRRPGDADDDATIERVVGEMRAAIREETGLPASAGIARSRPIAKMASGAAKPDGTRMVRVGGELAFVRDLPVRRWPGIGPVAGSQLEAAGIATLGELLAHPHDGEHGALAEAVRAAVHGDAASRLGRDRPAFREHDPDGLTVGSISNESTFAADVGDRQAIADRLRALTGRVCWRARRRNVVARTITLKLRYADFETVTRARTIDPTSAERVIFRCVRGLFRENYDPPSGTSQGRRRRRVRLLGVALSNLQPGRGQLELPYEADEQEKVGDALDVVRERFGYDAIGLGASAGRKRRA